MTRASSTRFAARRGHNNLRHGDTSRELAEGRRIRLGKRYRRPKPPISSVNHAIGAVEKTRTSTGYPTATSTLRVYQFRHDREKAAPCNKRKGRLQHRRRHSVRGAGDEEDTAALTPGQTPAEVL